MPSQAVPPRVHRFPVARRVDSAPCERALSCSLVALGDAVGPDLDSRVIDAFRPQSADREDSHDDKAGDLDFSFFSDDFVANLMWGALNDFNEVEIEDEEDEPWQTDELVRIDTECLFSAEDLLSRLLNSDPLSTPEADVDVFMPDEECHDDMWDHPATDAQSLQASALVQVSRQDLDLGLFADSLWETESNVSVAFVDDLSDAVWCREALRASDQRAFTFVDEILSHTTRASARLLSRREEAVSVQAEEESLLKVLDIIERGASRIINRKRPELQDPHYVNQVFGDMHEEIHAVAPRHHVVEEHLSALFVDDEVARCPGAGATFDVSLGLVDELFTRQKSVDAQVTAPLTTTHELPMPCSTVVQELAAQVVPTTLAEVPVTPPPLADVVLPVSTAPPRAPRRRRSTQSVPQIDVPTEDLSPYKSTLPIRAHLTLSTSPFDTDCGSLVAKEAFEQANRPSLSLHSPLDERCSSSRSTEPADGLATQMPAGALSAEPLDVPKSKPTPPVANSTPSTPGRATPRQRLLAALNAGGAMCDSELMSGNRSPSSSSAPCAVSNLTPVPQAPTTPVASAKAPRRRGVRVGSAKEQPRHSSITVPLDVDDSSGPEGLRPARTSSLARNYKALDTELHCLDVPWTCSQRRKGNTDSAWDASAETSRSAVLGCSTPGAPGPSAWHGVAAIEFTKPSTGVRFSSAGPLLRDNFKVRVAASTSKSVLPVGRKHCGLGRDRVPSAMELDLGVTVASPTSNRNVDVSIPAFGSKDVPSILEQNGRVIPDCTRNPGGKRRSSGGLLPMLVVTPRARQHISA